MVLGPDKAKVHQWLQRNELPEEVDQAHGMGMTSNNDTVGQMASIIGSWWV